ncbi:MAG: branched-chain amino acid ABC transporter permease [Acidimicrobiia bacterium]
MIRNRLGLLAGLVAVAAALAAPAVADDAMLRTLAGVFMFGGLASAWNIIGGFTGYASFGNVVFFGLGGYTVAVLMVHARWDFWTALPVAVAVGAGYAALVGLPVLRLRGHYFAIATLGVAEGTREVVLNLPGLTGGGAGISLPVLGAQAITASPGNTSFYYLFLAAMGVAVAVAFAVSRSRFGYGLRAIHDDEQGAAATGINTTRAKLAAFAISGALTSLIGALFAFQQVAIYPERLFSVEITVLMVAMAVIGGMGTVIGPVIGAVGLQLLAEYLRQRYLGLHLIVFGSLVVAVVVLMPEGLVSSLSQAWRERQLDRQEGRQVKLPSLLDTVRRYRV